MNFSVCVVIRNSPYGNVMPAEAYRTIQALQTFEREVSVLFMADGVLTMVDSTDPSQIGMHRLAEAYVALMELPGVTLAVHRGSLRQRGFKEEDLIQLPGDTRYRFVTSDEMESFITGHKTVLCM
jgi:sulfur relay (sulfurtransferase) DsrF/TusC family protein